MRYWGSVDRAGKLEFLQSIDVLSVPATHFEPKGLFVLEALAAGVPVVLPNHAAFPELIERLGGGRLVPVGDTDALVRALEEFITDREAARTLGQQGRAQLLATSTTRHEAQAMIGLLTALRQDAAG